MKTDYKTVYDLSPDELDELRDSYYWQYLGNGTIDVDTFDGIPDDMLFEHYAGISFVNDDFFCNQKEG